METALKNSLAERNQLYTKCDLNQKPTISSESQFLTVIMPTVSYLLISLL